MPLELLAQLFRLRLTLGKTLHETKWPVVVRHEPKTVSKLKPYRVNTWVRFYLLNLERFTADQNDVAREEIDRRHDAPGRKFR